MGDKCTVCRDEYKNFSSAGCSPCGCDVNGSLSAVCDKRSGQCPCKVQREQQLLHEFSFHFTTRDCEAINDADEKEELAR